MQSLKNKINKNRRAKMIISKTPYRVSFVGGGSDLPVFYRNSPGAVVSTSISKYMYVTLCKHFSENIRLAYTETENVDHVSKLKHELAREAIKMTQINHGLEIATIGEIPARTGLGSSSAVTIGLLNACWNFKGIKKSALELAQEACKIEIDILDKPIGKQDQYACALGGLNFIQFNPDDTVEVSPIQCSIKTKNRLDKNLLMFYTGQRRKTDDILREQSKNTVNQKKKRKILEKMVGLAYEMKSVLEKDDLSGFGELLHKNWLFKKQMASKISNSNIDKWYRAGRRAGAEGGKILGAGGGGFMLFYCLEKNQKNLIQAMQKYGLKEEKFYFEPTGSQIFFI